MMRARYSLRWSIPIVIVYTLFSMWLIHALEKYINPMLWDLGFVQAMQQIRQETDKSVLDAQRLDMQNTQKAIEEAK